jgi:hypothetical protein
MPDEKIRKKVITADSASELNKKIEKYTEEGWEAIGSHNVVEIHRQNRFRGSELVDTIIKSEYSITIQFNNTECYCPFNSLCINCPNGKPYSVGIGGYGTTTSMAICTLFVPDPKTGTSPKCINCGKSEIDHLKIF